jgi:osmotically-inducible protein OsmY
VKAWINGHCLSHTSAAPTESEVDQSRHIPDGDITQAVRREIRRDGFVDTDGIDVRTTAGIVELTGTVNDLLAKERATRHAEVVKGVRSVSNRIAVSPKARPDDEIVTNVRNALLFDPATDGYELGVSSKEGVVHLTGKVQSWQERRLAERVAMGVRGVRKIDNDVTVDLVENRPDAEIAEDVRSRLRYDVLVGDGLVDTHVKDGTVELSGVVGSAAEKSRAFFDAWVRGVDDVDTSGLEVRWWAKEEDLRKDKYADRSDDEIESAVRAAALYDPRVNSYDLDIEADRGVVRLNGTVDHSRARGAAEQLAKDTVGVLRVDNQIQINPDKPIGDALLEKRVDTGLLIDPITESYEIDVSVDDGRVTLKGSVGTFLEKAQAEDVAAGIRGVTAILNQLEVTKPTAAYVYDAYLYPYYPAITTGAYRSSSSGKIDAEVAGDVQDELFWSPFVDSDEVHVSVDGGVATLSGTVDSYRERNAATENAFQGGAAVVKNELKVR